MAERLDCLVIGYNDMQFGDYANRMLARDPASAERRIFMRDHVRVNGDRLPYMDVINRYMNQRPGASGTNYYHIGEVPNLAAIYLANYLKKRGCSAEYASLFTAEKDRIAGILDERRPLLVAITTTFYQVPWPVEEIVRFVRSHSAGAQVVVGGPLVNNLVADLTPDALARAFDYMGADFYVREAQGENTLLHLTRALRDGTDVGSVPNLYVHADGAYRHTRSRPEANVLDEVAIDWDQFSDQEIGCVVQTRTARSCAYKCSFCDYPVRAGALSLTSIDVLEKEFAQLARRGVQHLIFIDDTFNVPGPRFKELCKMMIRNDFGLSWYSYFRCAAARDTETYDLLRDSGCKAVFLGIESGDQDVLDNMSKVATLDRYRRGLGELHERGVTTFASFISGFPGETAESVQNTLDFINDLTPTFFRVEPWWYNHRSPIHQQAENYQLTGEGYRWKHRSMDITGACDAMDAIFDEVHDSLWMPVYNFDFWAVPYLLSKGIEIPTLKEFHKLNRSLMKLNDTAEGDERARAEAAAIDQAMAGLFANVSMTGAKYQSEPGGPRGSS